MKEIIERLKDKTYVRAFGLMSEEEQEVYRKVGLNNCLQLKDEWVQAHGIGKPSSSFENSTTYAIKPDYQLEPEHVDLEIGVQCVLEREAGERQVWRLGVYQTHDYHWTTKILPNSFTTIDRLPSLPSFEGFFIKVGSGIIEQRMIESVASEIAEGKTVYARFRK